MRIIRIHHLTLAVRDLEQARETFAALFGAPAEHGDVIEAFGVRTADLALGDGTLQLAAPLEPEAPLTRFIDRKGEGFYNIALEVDDLDAAVGELAGRGIRISDPVEATPGVRSAFITMSATHGLSVQLMEVVASGTPAPPAPADEAPRESAPSAVEDATPDVSASPRLLDLTPEEWSDVD